MLQSYAGITHSALAANRVFLKITRPLDGFDGLDLKRKVALLAAKETVHHQRALSTPAIMLISPPHHDTPPLYNCSV